MTAASLRLVACGRASRDEHYQAASYLEFLALCTTRAGSVFVARSTEAMWEAER